MLVQMVLNMSSRDVLVLLGVFACFCGCMTVCACQPGGWMRGMDEGDGGGMERDVADDRR